MWILPITLVRTLQLRVRESILPDQQGVGNLPELLTALPRASLYQPSPAALWQEQRPEREGRLELLSFCWPISVLKSKMPLDHLNPWPFLIKKKKTDQQGWSYTKEGMAAAPPAASRCHPGLGRSSLWQTAGPCLSSRMPWTVKHFLVSLTPGASRANRAVLFCQVIKLPAARAEAPRRVSFAISSVLSCFVLGIFRIASVSFDAATNKEKICLKWLVWQAESPRWVG